ncbi:MAG: RluA family pseudouridine synthase [Eubacteriales bacterium]|nr:RluA family pseudouridine synthase [Eubacteriales bacterium]
MEIVYLVTDADHGLRAVDVLVAKTGMSRLMSKRIRLYGELLKNGKPWRMIDPVERGDQLVARTAGHTEQGVPLRQPPGIELVFQDDWLVILNKPAGLVVHPTYRHETGTLTDLLSDQPLHPVSRLDRDTSGLVMIARNGHAHYVVMQHPMKKTYLALVHGRMPQQQGLIDAPISRDPDSIIKRRVDPAGASARTRYRELHYFPTADVSTVEFELLTGRTHQIRVHSQFVGHPLVGETLYGPASEAVSPLDRQLGRQALHARSLGFIHPQTGESLLVHAPLPRDLRLILHQLS